MTPEEFDQLEPGDKIVISTGDGDDSPVEVASFSGVRLRFSDGEIVTFDRKILFRDEFSVAE